MKIIPGRAEDVVSENRTATFTGTVWGDPVLPATDGVTINNVFFAPGSRTYWHEHEHGQILHVTAGSGLICAFGQSPRVIRAGDTVWVPPGERHWHGAGGQSYLLHLAVSLGSTHWLDEVSENDYATTPAEG
ncbi:MAG: cupin domain-containing protein [Pseudonocardiaceae bacterium]|nr:cupin domain-containing protein [Pseudonocardiaceae bacterium]